ncbi:MAG: hypothetical protein ACFCGT_21125 [Sandaracinaceae bacterium]
MGCAARTGVTARIGGGARIGGAQSAGSPARRGGVGARLAVALAVTLAAASTSIPGAAAAQDVGGYVATEWRLLGIGEHVSHGPSFAAGISLLEDHLRLGIAGFARPGPINPRTWTIAPSTGEPYRGQDELTVRSDGAFVGVEIAGDLAPPRAPWLHVRPSATLGYAAFGFYLTGDDRDTPDGRRVSEWENELQDGRDAGFGFGLDLGLRLAFALPDAPWIRPTIGGGYFLVVGYDAYVRGSYNGPWATAGVEIAF